MTYGTVENGNEGVDINGREKNNTRNNIGGRIINVCLETDLIIINYII